MPIPNDSGAMAIVSSELWRWCPLAGTTQDMGVLPRRGTTCGVKRDYSSVVTRSTLVVEDRRSPPPAILPPRRRRTGEAGPSGQKITLERDPRTGPLNRAHDRDLTRRGTT